MTLTKKTFQSMQPRSREFNVAQADFNAVFTRAKTAIIVLTAREACFILQCCPENPRENDMVHEMGKVEGKTAFVLLKLLSRTF